MNSLAVLSEGSSDCVVSLVNAIDHIIARGEGVSTSLPKKQVPHPASRGEE
jgi:hypothetical protein